MANGFWGQLIQNGAVRENGPYLRDYAHASKTFLSNGYALAPKLKFLFHVYFDINVEAYGEGLGTGNNFGLAVKTVRLPSYTFNAVELNQYNRKRIVQTKIKYAPVNFTFHDDNSNMMTRLWEAYYTYYYKDGSNFGAMFNGARGNAPTTETQADYNTRNTYKLDITGNSNWGFIGESRTGSPSKIPFFKNITVFGFNQHHFTAYTLINPLISSFSHDTYAYASNDGTVEMNMDVDYETVVYNEGAIDGQTPDNIIQGFGLGSNYDRRLSPVTPKGTNGLVAANGGYIPANGGYVRTPPNASGTNTAVVK